MSRITPTIGTTGIFIFVLPWVVNPGETYTLAAIKTLEEVVRSGVDPKTIIYESVGLTDGVNGFDYAAEVSSKPLILTLVGSEGNSIAIPNTYIASYPSQSTVEYVQHYTSINLGLFPVDHDFTQLAADLADLASAYSTQVATATLYILPIDTQPTEAQHLAFENVRKYATNSSMSNTEQISLLATENDKLRTSNAALIARLKSVDPLFA